MRDNRLTPQEQRADYASPTKPCRAEACQRDTECEAFMESSMKRTESIPALSRLALTRRQMLLRNVIGLAEEP